MIAIELGAEGPNYGVASACAATLSSSSVITQPMIFARSSAAAASSLSSLEDI